MLCLKAPHMLLQITNDGKPDAEAMEIAKLEDWIWTIANYQHQAEQDLSQLMDVYGTTVDQTDRCIREIEGAYHKLWQRTQYIYK